MDMSLSKFREMVKDKKAWRAAVYGGHKESDTMSDLAGTQAESCYHPSPPSDVLYPNLQNLWLYMAKGISEM